LKILFPKKEGIFDSTFICDFAKILEIFLNDFVGELSPKKRESRQQIPYSKYLSQNGANFTESFKLLPACGRQTIARIL